MNAWQKNYGELLGRRQAVSSCPKRKRTHLPSPVRIPDDPRIDRVGPPFATLRVRLALDPLAHFGPISDPTLDDRAPQCHIFFLRPPATRITGGECHIESDDGARDRVPDHARDEGPVLTPPVYGREQQGIIFGCPRFARLVRAEVICPETSRRSSIRLCAWMKEGIGVNDATLIGERGREKISPRGLLRFLASPLSRHMDPAVRQAGAACSALPW